MAQWYGNPEDFVTQHDNVFAAATNLSIREVGNEVVGDTIQQPTTKGDFAELDVQVELNNEVIRMQNLKDREQARAFEEEKIRLAELREEMDEVEKLADAYDRQMDAEWEKAGASIFTTFQGALAKAKDAINDITTTVSTHSDDGSWSVYYPNNLPNSVDPEDEEDYITVSEFKDFIYDLIERRAGALPNLDDWREIKAQLDLLPEDYEEDEDDYYGSNEESILVGEAAGSTDPYRFDSTVKFTTTINGVEIQNPDIGDMFFNNQSNTVIVWDGSNWINSQGDNNE